MRNCIVFAVQDDELKMSCQCFAEMLINFHFGKFLALHFGHILGKVMPKFSVKCLDEGF